MQHLQEINIYFSFHFLSLISYGMRHFFISVHIRCLHHQFLGRLQCDGNCWWTERKSHPLFWYVTNFQHRTLACTSNFSTYYLSGEDSESSFFWNVMWCHILEEYRPQLHHCESLKTCMEGIHLTQDRNELWAVMNTLMNLQITQNVKSFLSSWANISLSRTAPWSYTNLLF